MVADYLPLPYRLLMVPPPPAQLGYTVAVQQSSASTAAAACAKLNREPVRLRSSRGSSVALGCLQMELRTPRLSLSLMYAPQRTNNLFLWLFVDCFRHIVRMYSSSITPPCLGVDLQELPNHFGYWGSCWANLYCRFVAGCIICSHLWRISFDLFREMTAGEG
ncbi:hypothetical protein AAHA92_05382 [Salvia divinorum]|uniref:Uncharacterized protein n=1 Tax=Salvia divinorum TaxID=28513 RepID=A0ABD1I295_SALDI